MTPPTSALDLDAQLPAVRHHRPGRSMSAAEAVALIPDGSRVFIEPFTAVPVVLVAEMAAQAGRWTRIQTVSDYLFEPLPIFEHLHAPFTHLCLQPTPAVDGLGPSPTGEPGLRIIPASSSQFSRWLAPDGPYPVDVAVVQVSPPDRQGRFSLGVLGGHTAELVRSASLVIAEVNPAMPFTRGVTVCERSDFDALVEVDHPLLELAPAAMNETAAAIGARVADLVVDGATIEYGIGAIPDAVLANLAGRTDLGLHSGMAGDGIIDLIERGVLNGRRKSVDAGLHVAAAIIGTRRVFDWIDGRDDVVMVGSNYSHGAFALARQDRFTAINSAVEVALDGSINAEMVGRRVVSGPGGQPDFALGASLAADGIAIVALPATAGSARASRIVPFIEPPRPVTVSRHLADRVVTELGVAELRGIDLPERARRLAAVADPERTAELQNIA